MSFVSTIVCLALALTSGGGIDNHNLTVSFDVETHILTAADTLKINTNGASFIPLLLNKNLVVEKAVMGDRELDVESFSGEDRNKLIDSFGWEDERLPDHVAILLIHFPEDLNGNATELQLFYRGEIYDNPENASFNRAEITRMTTGLIGEEGVYLAPSTYWYPTQPDHLPIYRMTVDAPAGWEVMSEGDIQIHNVTEEGNRIVFASEHPFDGLHLIAAKYVVTTEKQGDVDVMTYFLPGSEMLTKDYLTFSKNYIKMYEDMLGPYPFGKFAVVENGMFPSGYGMPSYTYLGAQVIRMPFIKHTSLGHEIAHNYWGNSVYVDWRSGNWCEGLTTYVADYHYAEQRNAEEAAEYRRNILRDYTNYVGAGKDFPLRKFYARHSAATRAVGYGKSMMVFHVIRKHIGDQAFYTSLKEIVKQFQWKNASWDDLLGVFSAEGKMDISWVNEQYLERAGGPMITLENAEISTVSPDSEIQGWRLDLALSQTQPLYRLKVPVHVDIGGEEIITEVDLTEPFQEYTLRVPTKPFGVRIDPNANMFRKMHRAEIPPVLSQIFGAESKLAVMPDSASEAAMGQYRAVAMMLTGGGKTGTMVSAAEVTDEQLATSTVMVIGGAAENSLADRWEMKLPGGSLVHSTGFVLEGTEKAAGAISAIACFRNPLNDELGAVMLAGSLDTYTERRSGKESTGIGSLMGRLMHYGKYSYLGFQNGQNVAKGIWKVEDSPLIRTFIK